MLNSTPDATSARLAESPDGPKNDPELNPTAGNTQIQSRPGRLECQAIRWFTALRTGMRTEADGRNSDTFMAQAGILPSGSSRGARPKKNTGRVHPPGSYWKNTLGGWNETAGICPLFLVPAISDNRSAGLRRRPRRA